MVRKRGRPKGSTKRKAEPSTKEGERHWVDQLIDLYQEGASDVEVCRALCVSYNEFDKRYQTDPNFSKLVDYGRLAAKAWWMELGRKGASGKHSINYSVWYAVMKNRFGWSDRVEAVASEGDKPVEQMSQDEIVAAINSKRDALVKLLKTSNVRISELAATSSDELN